MEEVDVEGWKGGTDTGEKAKRGRDERGFKSRVNRKPPGQQFRG